MTVNEKLGRLLKHRGNRYVSQRKVVKLIITA